MWEDKIGQGIWTERVDDETGRSSIELHKLKPVWKSCPRDECFFEEVEPRIAKCKKCGKLIPLVVGKDQIIDGKIIRN